MANKKRNKKYDGLKRVVTTVNLIHKDEMIPVVLNHKETVAYLHKKNIINDELLCRLVNISHLFEIIFVYYEDKKHYNTIVKPQFDSDKFVEIGCEIEETLKLKEIIKTCIFKYQTEEVQLSDKEIELITEMSNYIINVFENIKCRILFACFILYAKQQNKLFLIQYKKLNDYYKITLDKDFILCLKYRIKNQIILNKFYKQKQIAVFDYETFKLSYITQEYFYQNMDKYKKTAYAEVVECVN